MRAGAGLDADPPGDWQGKVRRNYDQHKLPANAIHAGRAPGTNRSASDEAPDQPPQQDALDLQLIATDELRSFTRRIPAE